MTIELTHNDAGFGVYLHWPFCAAKCPYCDFNSHVRHRAVDQKRFVEAFQSELRYFRDKTGPRNVRSIFLGGGTPSLMHPDTVEALLKTVGDLWSIDADAEITLEANPSSVEADRFRAYRSVGVNRVSLGVQALNDQDLKFLGRLHDVKQALYAIELARETFPRLSFDLIYARPHQSLQSWEAELKQAISYAVDHLSLYQLTIEEGTPFFALYNAKKFDIPDPDHAAALYQLTQEITAAHGLPSYEISNHAKIGCESRHNLIYWRYGDYVGAGPGAHGRLPDGTKRRVTMAERHPETWLTRVEAEGHGIIENEYLNHDDQSDELLLMGLRLKEGIDLTRYEALAGKALPQRQLDILTEHELIESLGNSHLRATPKGMLVLDALVADLAR